ncbi:AMP-binding protein [Microbulbifer hydrolyticus]|uniref:AMP-binding protein n=1 Tax=Microbulbifer hydrolyticus TaxID=48074 RepID=A0A6P1TG60_9GAMM|nr:AMP-binding protein [Microbulbifer hydrolyticus]MBB5212648.1 long-subunit acyl-CoA synthetase (AMP-forming) [Microbulbifer hydrolyticus]QHQ40249.1 AMP-binding protein [Microbulbifer hydrolyticus]
MQLIEQITAYAAQYPTRNALVGLRGLETGGSTKVNSNSDLSYAQLFGALDALASGLQRQGIEVLGLFADNGPEWLLVDLACQQAGVTLVPLPGFFSAQQLEHTIRASGMQALLTDDCERFTPLEPVGEALGELAGLTLIEIPQATRVALPAETAKVTFTSGSTGTPRGVCLANETQYATAAALAQALVELGCARHLCLLPLATLLENVAGAYTCWLLGGTVIAPSLEKLGFHGSSQLDPAQLCRCIDECQPDSLILLPQILKLLVAQVRLGQWQAPPSLRFVAVGGGKVSPELLRQARTLGLPVFEGYGLSECGSVVALNLPGADCPGAAGRPLPHCEIRVCDGEVQVRGPRYLGYLGDSGVGSDMDGDWLATGDLGAIDKDGFLHITGRKKNLLISAFGRNISPEWVESEILLTPMLLQCVVIGDARPHCCALVFPLPGTEDAQVDRWIQAINERLPDYAQIRNWARLPAPLSFDDGLLTANGRPRRDAISHRYAESIETLYGESHAVL